MPERVHFSIQTLPRLYVVGKSLRYSMEDISRGENPIPAFWELCMRESAMKPLMADGDLLYNQDYVGYMGCRPEEDGHYDYVCGMLLREKPEIFPEGYDLKVIESTHAAVAWIRGQAPTMYTEAHAMTEQALAEAGYRAVTPLPWCMEGYNCPRFTEPGADGSVILDYYIPCEKA